MSRPYDFNTREMTEQGHAMYESSLGQPYPRLLGPTNHYDGVAFWYRPNITEQISGRESSLFNRGIALPGGNLDSTGIKHRRTRSGCFTCRSRRVKCDETRPICERCKKGGRECEFPQPSSASKRTKQPDSRSPLELTRHDAQESAGSGLDTIKDESSEETVSMKSSRRPHLKHTRKGRAQSANRKNKHGLRQESPPGVKEKTSPLSTGSSRSHSREVTSASSLPTGATSAEITARQAKIKTLKPDIQKHLQFQHNHMTFYHYFFKIDTTDFIHNEFIDQALSFEPLLYAVVGFAAYHYELRQTDGKLAHFLRYYSKSLSMLRKSLEKQSQFTEAMLLTVLQLATFEECIGDWVNLVGHHRAAHTMIVAMFNPHSIHETELGRHVFNWYGRFDVIAGLMAGNEARLDRSWFEVDSDWYQAQIDPDLESDVDVDSTLGYFVAQNRLVGMDMAALFAKLPRQEIGIDEFLEENAKIVQRLEEMKQQIESLNDAFYTVHEFPMADKIPLTEDDIVDPYIPGGLFRDVLWALNFMWIDWYAIEQMHMYQFHLLLQRPLPPQLEAISLEQCRIYEAIERWPDAPEGAVLGGHASLGLAIVFLKNDNKHINWARRKLANIERLGYIFPPAFRQQMAERWGLTTALVGSEQSVDEWWLPNDEGRLDVLSEVRKVVKERHEGSDEKTMSGDLGDVRDIKAIFARLDLRTRQALRGQVIDDFSPQSDGTRSASSTGLGSPSNSSAASAGGGVGSGVGAGVGDERRTSTTPTAAAVLKGMAKRGSVNTDRMSGVWP